MTRMTNNINQSNINNSICEAIGCFENATKKIDVNAGQFGKISLFLCKKCLPKFTAKGT
ncbi:MAG: hypothetical protein ACRD6U_05940 [Nitrososphaeraceae archaeon]